MTCLRKEREDHWIKTFRTVYPYGLNDRLKDDYMTDQNSTRIGSKFPKLKRSFQRISRGFNRKGKSRLNHLEFLKN